MATRKVSERTAILGSAVDVDADYIPIIDTSGATSGSSKILVDELGVALSIPKRRYVALFSQSGTGAPTVAEHINTLGVTVTWAYTSTGIYTGTFSTSLAGGTNIKGTAVVAGASSATGFALIINSANGALKVYSYNLSGTLADDILAGTELTFERIPT